MPHSKKRKTPAPQPRKTSLARELGQALVGALLCGCVLIGHSCFAQQFGPAPQREAAPSPTSAPIPTATPTVAPTAAPTPEETPLPEATAAVPEETPLPEESPQPEENLHPGEGMLSPSSDSAKDSVFGQASAQETVTDEKMTALLTRIQGELPASNGAWSLYLCDLSKNSEGSLNEGSMQAASLIKLFIMGAVYENYETLAGQYGSGVIDSQLNAMITVSDNDAANALVGYLGGGDSQTGMSIVNAFCQAHGYTHTSMGRLLLQSNAMGDNYTSVTDCGHFLKDIYKGDYEEFPYGDAMFGLLCGQTRRNKIPAQLPSGVKVANKTGELSDVENDAGILYDSQRDLVLVFMSEYLTDPAAAQNTIASLSREIYNSYQEG